MDQKEFKLRKLICKIGRLMRRYGYIDGGSGNISARLSPAEDGSARILLTPSGLAKGFMKPEQLIVVNLDGQKIGPGTDANADLRPSSETPMHLECYRQRPDVGGVVHAHPPAAVALTIAGISLAQCVVPESVMLLGLIPTMEYATPSSEEDREAVRAAIQIHDALMLAHHGSLTVGPDVWTAYLRLETVEHYANILHKVYQVGSPNPLTPDQIRKLLDIRQRWGLMRPMDEALFAERFGVPTSPNSEG